MVEYMANIKLLTLEKNNCDNSYIIVCNINNIMFIQIFKIIQRWIDFFQIFGGRAITFLYIPTKL